MARVSEIFGDLDGYTEQDRGEFVLLPHGAFVLAKITGLKGKVGACMLESTTERIQAGLDGNYGHPKFWDHVNFITPKPVDETADEDGIKKAKAKIGMWARRLGALGLDPAGIKAGFDEGQYAAFFTPALGQTVIIKTRLEAASGEYKAKNTANDYYPDTDANLKKYGLEEVSL